MSKITIRLKSDLCTATGYSHGGVINSDVSYDMYGLPYIPARRLKGCLRENAEFLRDNSDLISENDVFQLFGRPGEDKTSGILVHNAYLLNYKNICEVLEKQREQKGAYSKYLTPQKILEQYTSIKEQTRIKNGVADKNSLRYIRVIQQYSPIKKDNKYEEVVFEANVEHNYLPEKVVKEKMELICKALRHIGLLRNRGLGNVQCEFSYKEENDYKNQLPDVIGEEVELQYILKNHEPILLTGRNNNETERYISGQSILGALVSTYLRTHRDEADQKFERLFLTNKVIYSNLYLAERIPSQKEEMEENDLRQKYKIYYPAPLCIGSYKLSENYTNLFEEDEKRKMMQGSNKSDRPKSLKGKFLAMTWEEETKSWKCEKKEPQVEKVYHHRSEGNDGVNEILYMHDALSKNQLFFGTIKGRKEDIKEIIDLLRKTRLKIGKSKTAQYGFCQIVESYIKTVIPQPITIQKGEEIIAILRSDALLIHPKTGYSVNVDCLDNEIKKAIGWSGKINEKSIQRILGCKILSGYYTKWNMQKQTLPAFTAGTAVSYVYEGDKPLKISDRICSIGEKNGEGFGVCEIFSKRTFQIKQREAKEKKQVPEVINHQDALENEQSQDAKTLIRCVLLERLKEELLLAAMKNENKIIDNTALLGRVMLMLEDSLREDCSYIDNEKKYNSFLQRIQTISDDKKRNKILDYVKRTKQKLDQLQEWKMETDLPEIQLQSEGNGCCKGVEFSDEIKEIAGLLYQLEKEWYKEESEYLWSSYFRQVFMHWRYEFKREEKKSDDQDTV